MTTILPEGQGRRRVVDGKTLAMEETAMDALEKRLEDMETRLDKMEKQLALLQARLRPSGGAAGKRDYRDHYDALEYPDR